VTADPTLTAGHQRTQGRAVKGDRAVGTRHRRGTLETRVSIPAPAGMVAHTWRAPSHLQGFCCHRRCAPSGSKLDRLCGNHPMIPRCCTWIGERASLVVKADRMPPAPRRMAILAPAAGRPAHARSTRGFQRIGDRDTAAVPKGLGRGTSAAALRPGRGLGSSCLRARLRPCSVPTAGRANLASTLNPEREQWTMTPPSSVF
jgi:hypothetical protein